MDKTLLSSGAIQELGQKPVYINKKFKIHDESDHSFRNSSCLLNKYRVTALFVNLIKNLLQLIRKEEQVKPRLQLHPYSVETVSSLESMPYLHLPSCRIRGRKARQRCMLCPGAHHTTCIPRRRVVSMTPANACCKVGKCYVPSLPPSPNVCPFHHQVPCPVRPCTPRPTTPIQSKFPPKRDSYMHMPCDATPCDRKEQGGGCLSVTALPPPRCTRPIPCLEPVPSCYNCPRLAPCHFRRKPRAKPKLSRPNLCKRQCIMNPCKETNRCQPQYTAATTTDTCPEMPPCCQPCPQPCSIPCPQQHTIICPPKICVQEINTDTIKYCISTQTSIAILPEVRCGPSHSSQPKMAQTGPSRTNIVENSPSNQVYPRRSQVQFNQSMQSQPENSENRADPSASKSCACQASSEPLVVSDVCQPLGPGVFIRFPDNMVTNGIYGVSIPAVVTQNSGLCPSGGNGGAMEDGRPPTQDSRRKQWGQPSALDQTAPARQKASGWKTFFKKRFC